MGGCQKKEISTVKLNAFRHTYVGRPNNDGQNIFFVFSNFTYEMNFNLVLHFPVLNFHPCILVSYFLVVIFRSCIFRCRLFRSRVFQPSNFCTSFFSPVCQCLIYLISRFSVLHFHFTTTNTCLSHGYTFNGKWTVVGALTLRIDWMLPVAEVAG